MSRSAPAAWYAAWEGRLSPCGTASAARRHYRRGEPLDAACLEANRVDVAQRAGRPAGAGQKSAPLSAVRNGLPIVAYDYRARRYPWAERALAAAEAVYGSPDDEDQAVAS